MTHSLLSYTYTLSSFLLQKLLNPNIVNKLCRILPFFRNFMSYSVLGCLTYLLDVENQLDTDWKNINSEKKLIKTFELKNTEKSQRKIVNKIHQLLHFNIKKLYNKLGLSCAKLRSSYVSKSS